MKDGWSKWYVLLYPIQNKEIKGSAAKLKTYQPCPTFPFLFLLLFPSHMQAWRKFNGQCLKSILMTTEFFSKSKVEEFYPWENKSTQTLIHNDFSILQLPLLCSVFHFPWFVLVFSRLSQKTQAFSVRNLRPFSQVGRAKKFSWRSAKLGSSVCSKLYRGNFLPYNVLYVYYMYLYNTYIMYYPRLLSL